MVKRGKDGVSLEIRAHHLLCLLGFRGLGYSKEFTENMKNVSAIAFSDGTVLKIVDRCDAICVPCPHREESDCGKGEDGAEKTTRQDQGVASSLGIKIGDEMPSQEIWALVKGRITPLDLHQLCRGCEWLDYCLKFSAAACIGSE